MKRYVVLLSVGAPCRRPACIRATRRSRSALRILTCQRPSYPPSCRIRGRWPSGSLPSVGARHVLSSYVAGSNQSPGQRSVGAASASAGLRAHEQRLCLRLVVQPVGAGVVDPLQPDPPEHGDVIRRAFRLQFARARPMSEIPSLQGLPVLEHRWEVPLDRRGANTEGKR
jgi:hypothetical protein